MNSTTVATATTKAKTATADATKANVLQNTAPSTNPASTDPTVNPILSTLPFVPSWLGQLDQIFPTLRDYEVLNDSKNTEYKLNRLVRQAKDNISILLQLAEKQPVGGTAHVFHKSVFQGSETVARIVDILTCDDVNPNRYGELFFPYGVHEYRDKFSMPLPGIEVDHSAQNTIVVTGFSSSDGYNSMRRRSQYVRRFLIPQARFRVLQSIQDLVLTRRELCYLDPKTIVLLSDLKKYLSGLPQQTCLYAASPGATHVPHAIIPSLLDTYHHPTSQPQSHVTTGS